GGAAGEAGGAISLILGAGAGFEPAVKPAIRSERPLLSSPTKRSGDRGRHGPLKLPLPETAQRLSGSHSMRPSARGCAPPMRHRLIVSRFSLAADREEVW